MFDAFLAEYPLCYVYWHRYAEYELNHTGGEACRAVYERAVSEAGIPYCVELWEFYCQYAITKSTLGNNEKEAIFERALQRIQLDWNAAKIWELYIYWQAENNPEKTLSVYERALAIPMARLEDIFQRYDILIIFPFFFSSFFSSLASHTMRSPPTDSNNLPLLDP